MAGAIGVLPATVVTNRYHSVSLSGHTRGRDRLNDYTYRVIGKKWVAPTDTAVLDPVPSHPRQRPTRRLITLITCDPAWTGTHRVIVTGVLVAAKPR